MSRKRQDSNVHNLAFKCKKEIETRWGSIKVQLSLKQTPEVLKNQTGIMVQWDRRLFPEPMVMGEGPEFDDWREKIELAFTLFSEALEKTLPYAIKNAILNVERRLPLESERRTKAIRYPYVKRGRKPGSKQKPELIAGKVRRRIAEMEEAARRLARRKNANWSWAGLAREMGLSQQTLLAYAKKHPEVRQRGDQILREQGYNF